MIIRKLNLGFVVLMALILITSPASADRDSDDNDQDSGDQHIKSDKPGLDKKIIRTEKRDNRENNIRAENRENRDRHVKNDREKQYKERGYKLDKRYSHNHYYPPRGYVVRTLPRRYRVVPYRGVDYYFYSGVWYRHSGIGFSVVIPPVGIVVPALPPYYTTIWVGSIPYYYAGGVYYVWRPYERGYEVVKAPPEDEVEQRPSVPSELFIYPKEGQSEEQQANDRYECYSWAVGQTGFDPTQPGGNVPVEQHESKLADYQRAMTACLEGRGYSVK